jgi:hypothetical protein
MAVGNYVLDYLSPNVDRWGNSSSSGLKMFQRGNAREAKIYGSGSDLDAETSFTIDAARKIDC